MPIFQSTPPARGATVGDPDALQLVPISIHAPREGGDRRLCGWNALQTLHFNPRPPRGGRQSGVISSPSGTGFQSTPPARGATFKAMETLLYNYKFQSTPPARGATHQVSGSAGMLPHFNPRPPRGGRLMPSCNRRATCAFQSTPPARGATFAIPPVPNPRKNFNPRPPRGGRPARRP